jgi:ubiquitin
MLKYFSDMSNDIWKEFTKNHEASIVIIVFPSKTFTPITVNISVKSSDTIATVKDNVAIKLKTMFEKPIIRINSKILENNQRMCECDIGGEDVLVMTEMIQLFVKLINGKIVRLWIEHGPLGPSVLRLKHILMNEMLEKGYVAIPPNMQRLIYSGRQLEDSNTCWTYNISMEATLHLMLRLDGTLFQATAAFKTEKKQEEQDPHRKISE